MDHKVGDEMLDTETLQLIKQLQQDDQAASAAQVEISVSRGRTAVLSSQKRKRQEDEDASFALALSMQSGSSGYSGKGSKAAETDSKLGMRSSEIMFASHGVIVLKRALGVDEQMGLPPSMCYNILSVHWRRCCEDAARNARQDDHFGRQLHIALSALHLQRAVSGC